MNLEGYSEAVDQCWNSPAQGTAMFRLNSKLCLVNGMTKQWLYGQSSMRYQISAASDLTVAAENLAADPNNSQLQQAKLDAKDKLLQLQARDEEDCRQRSRIDWLKLGDSNSSFFSKMAKDHTLCNSRLCDVDSQGRVMTTREELAAEVIEFYSELFRERSMTDEHCWFPCLVTDDMNLWLYRLPPEEEVARNFSSLAPNKSPGPDGFMGVFFQRYWLLIKQDVMGMVRDFFNGRGSLKHIKTTFVTFIPKVSGVSRIQEFWPILGFNTIYKNSESSFTTN